MLQYIENRNYIFHNKESHNLDDKNNVRALWRAVITQALMDASNSSKKSFNKMEKIRARDWLKGDSEDFLSVCELADMDPYYVKMKAAEAIARNCKWRNDCKPTKNKYHKSHHLYDNIYYGK